MCSYEAFFIATLYLAMSAQADKNWIDIFNMMPCLKQVRGEIFALMLICYNLRWLGFHFEVTCLVKIYIYTYTYIYIYIYIPGVPKKTIHCLI